MIEAEKSVVINAGIDSVWDYVRDIRRWANFFPSCQDCSVIDDHNSRWVIKVGAGGLVRTVNVLVLVNQWAGPERVNFSYQLESEPVNGHGCYTASSKGPRETEITLKVDVEGSGSMAPMWEAVSKPLLPQMASSFAGRLKGEIEGAAGKQTTPSITSIFFGLIKWIRQFWRATTRTGNQLNDPGKKETVMTEENKAVVTQFIKAMGAGDAAVAAKCLDPDARTLAKGFGKFGGVRHYDTIVGTIEAFKKLFRNGLQPDIKSVIAEGNKVAVEFQGNATTYEGNPYCNEYCMVFGLRDGKIKQVNEYFCTIRADEVLWPLVEKMMGESASG